MARPSAVDLKALQDFLDEARLLFHRLGGAENQMFDRDSLSGGMRGVIRDLARLGPRTVPRLARLRDVSRQHIQSLVDALEEAGFVVMVDNPAHRRSRLARLTRQGRICARQLARLESRLLAGMPRGRRGRHLQGATATLRQIREALQGATTRRRPDL